MKLFVFLAIFITRADVTKLSTSVHHNLNLEYEPAQVLNPLVLVRLQKPAILRCHAFNDTPLSTCSWKISYHGPNVRGRLISFDTISSMSINGNNASSPYHYVGSGSGLENGECGLGIRNVTEKDIGTWTCILRTNVAEEQFRGKIKTELPVRPTVEIKPNRTQSATLNGNLSFYCTVVDKLSPSNFTWLRADGSELPSTASSDENGCLTFTNVSFTDEGKYECTAKNEAGADTGVAELTFKESSGGSMMKFIKNLALLFALVSVVCYACVHMCLKIARDRTQRQRLRDQIRDLTKEELEDFHNGSGNPSVGNDAHKIIHSLPFNRDLEIPRDKLFIHMNKFLGAGEFGVMREGLLTTGTTGIGDSSSPLTVAVKMVKPHVGASHFIALLSEIKILASLRHHTNIVSLLGTVTAKIKNREVLIALEFCAKKDLLRYLRKNRDRFSHTWSKEPETVAVIFNNQNQDVNLCTIPLKSESGSCQSQKQNNSVISTLDLLNWSHQISCGMLYLHSKQIIHGDLAARNILVSENNIAKISNFGLSRQLVNLKNHTKKSNSPLRRRRLAIETLTDLKFSLQSDIWSFGVTLWEIFTLGEVPYSERKWNRKFEHELETGQRLGPPKFGNKEIYHMMLNCTKGLPAERICFQEIMTQLQILGARPFTCERQDSQESKNFKLTQR